MSLEDTIKELKEQIEAEEKKEEAPKEEENPEVSEEEKPEESPEEKEEEKKEEPEEAPKEEQKAEAKEEEPADDKGWARLRREAAAAKKRAEEAERKLAERAEEKEEPVESNLPPEVRALIHKSNVDDAAKEFQIYEHKFKERTKDYEGVAQEYTNALAQSIRLQNPRLSPVEIAEKTKLAVLTKASEFVRAGFDPVEELYHEAKELGFTGASLKKKEEAKEEPKPDMKKVAANRARSTNMAATNGESKAGLTRNYIAEHGITSAEWVKLPPEEKRRLMYG